MTMATTYASIEKDLLEQARKDAAAYAAQRLQTAKTQLEDYTADLEKEYKATEARYNQQVRQAKQEEVPARNEAAVKAALTRRQVRERLADKGLAGSGAEQAALFGADSAKRIAEAQSKAREQAAINEIHAAIQKAYRTMKSKQAEKRRSLNEAAAKDIRNQRAALEKAARTRASQIARSDKALALWEKG